MPPCFDDSILKSNEPLPQATHINIGIFTFFPHTNQICSSDIYLTATTLPQKHLKRPLNSMTSKWPNQPSRKSVDMFPRSEFCGHFRSLPHTGKCPKSP